MVRPALWTVVAALPSCGLLTSSDVATPFPGDGVAGFGDASPIDLCLGAAHVVPPAASTGAGAVCIPVGAVAKACSSDATCSGIERCFCGRCSVEACAGASCESGRVCRDNRCTTPCAADADCRANETCSGGGCARNCNGDSDCYHGERCDDLGNTCAAQICSDAVPCAPGSTCDAVEAALEPHEPEVATIGGATTAFVELRPSGAGATGDVYRVQVNTSTRWTVVPQPVLPAAGAPSVLVSGERVDMYFALPGGAGIGHAVSSDGGVTFTRDAAPVLAPVPGWEQGFVGSPAAVVWKGETLLFYEGGPRAGIGLARVAGGAATRVTSAPVVTAEMVTDPLFWRDVTEVGAPYAVAVGDVLRVYFTGRGVEGSDAIVNGLDVPADPNDSIGMAASLDGQTFSPYPTGPVFARVTNLRSYLGEREAAVRLLSNGAEITFVGTDASGADESGLGRAGP
jgi:hypothetical protein